MYDKTNTYRHPQLVFSQYNLTKSIQNPIQNFAGKTFFYKKFSRFLSRSPDFKQNPLLTKSGVGGLEKY